MQEYNLPYFGAIDLTNIKDYYQTTTEFANNRLSLDLNFDKKQISQDAADSIKKILLSLDALDKQNHLSIDKDFRKESPKRSTGKADKD